MVDRLRFHPLVPSDLRDAIGWYGGISDPLVDRFREMVHARFDDIEAHPERFARLYHDVRCAQVEKFPYLILFRETQRTVFVLGVFHAASDPEKWRQRAVST